MELYIAKKDFAANAYGLIAKNDYLELFEVEDGVHYFQVLISSFALGIEIGLTSEEVKKFLHKIVAS